MFHSQPASEYPVSCANSFALLRNAERPLRRRARHPGTASGGVRRRCPSPAPRRHISPPGRGAGRHLGVACRGRQPRVRWGLHAAARRRRAGSPAPRQRWPGSASHGPEPANITHQGGAAIPMTIEFFRKVIPTGDLVESLKAGEDGALVVFDGIVRNNTRGRKTVFLDYESYEQMALEQMRALAAEAIQKFGVRDIVLVHRLGRLEIGETSVLIAVASAHRGAAF